jgi:hypothetical protein
MVICTVHVRSGLHGERLSGFFRVWKVTWTERVSTVQQNYWVRPPKQEIELYGNGTRNRFVHKTKSTEVLYKQFKDSTEHNNMSFLFFSLSDETRVKTTSAPTQRPNLSP